MNPYALPLPDAKLAQVQARFMSGLTGLAPELAEIGQISLERISTPNWALEWGLPLWLGDMLGLSEDVTLELEHSQCLYVGVRASGRRPRRQHLNAPR